jgi:hypothetical protein
LYFNAMHTSPNRTPVRDHRRPITPEKSDTVEVR